MLNQDGINTLWKTVDEVVERWRMVRQTMLVQYIDVTAILDSDPSSPEAATSLQVFCQLLVDYVSSGHFEVYQQLLREAEEFEDGGANAAKALLPQIVASTEAAMEFNDKYAVENSDFTTLKSNLSKLGEILESRFELEDQLIDILHEVHRNQTAQLEK